MGTKSHIDEHIDRCVELYAGTIDTDFSEPIDRAHFEQMRADLLIMVGMVAALSTLQQEAKADV